MILSSVIKKRLSALESKRLPVAADQVKRLIATALEVPSDPTLNGTHSVSGNVATFYNSTLALAFADRVQWLSEQPSGLIAMVCPRDSGDKVLEVLAERHADD